MPSLPGYFSRQLEDKQQRATHLKYLQPDWGMETQGVCVPLHKIHGTTRLYSLGSANLISRIWFVCIHIILMTLEIQLVGGSGRLRNWGQTEVHTARLDIEAGLTMCWWLARTSSAGLNCSNLWPWKASGAVSVLTVEKPLPGLCLQHRRGATLSISKSLCEIVMYVSTLLSICRSRIRVEFCIDN